ncbi:hypothetical protein BCV72DRAFT_236298 [Rhizopus microsporus var. microsporus]|uniref:CNH-domain-containing protein n=2 Tax=Rhizopus microsporus TaxID=58291 RepID=A0A2G4SWU2_RHIZD|nr:uncharacterized protein RHIMIDRAFT_281685 [Rhizopus microsporus ATCC 52813]ORE01506.1 hypothetical protein BCV72DRAFT_236298 [Rhizopus microsporus var. microsporus]PHZ13214.1 hypothetical protein RHIMIDRAFT_281685 [Rhizopus microsporus ATCC 52813]
MENTIKRSPTTTINYTGGPIPDIVKKCYVQQQLPVRKQSLAAYSIRKRNFRPSSITKMPLHPPGNWIQEEDEFDFKDRPPSTVVCTEPVDPSQILDEEDSTTYLSTNYSEEMLIDDVDMDDQQREWRKASLSSDTVTIFQLNDIQTSSFLLKMQQKKQEQQKSIDAYYNKSIHNALLSQVASEFYRRISLATLTRDNIEYRDAFSGKEAINCLLSVLCIQDRKQALSIGRALGSQQFFHDVNYEHQLLDCERELYVFRHKKDDISTKDESQIIDLPQGVYTPFTNCYSITCTTQHPCYSFSCPKRKGLKRSMSQSSAHEKEEETNSLWIHSVPGSIVEATSSQEIKRQESIYELIYTERNFVRDLQYIDNFWIKPLLTNDIIAEDRREAFVEQVFWNIAEIESVNSKLSKALDQRQAESYLVSSIGDVMLRHICHFMPFVSYGAHQVIGKFYFELEKKRNPQFAQFVEETERKPQSRRLELNGYLTKPTTRLGRYNLLLREIFKRTPDDHPDKEAIPQVMGIITQYLVQVNAETGRRENLFNLEQIQERLSFKSPAEYADLQLQDPERQLLLKGRMKRKGNTSSESADLQVFLFDNYLVIAKIKHIDHLEVYRAFRKPIPLELLSVHITPNNNRQKRASSILPYSKSPNTSNNTIPKPSTSENGQATKSNNLSITFTHHGRRGAPPLTLYATSASNQQLWIKAIAEQQEKLEKKRCVFSILPMIKNHFTTANRVNNTVTLDSSNKKLLIGTDQGVYITNKDSETKKLTISRIVHLEKVSQIEVMPNSQLLVLADKTLWSFPLDILSPNAASQMKRGRSVSQNTAFFHVGECLSKTLVCVVKSNTLSATTIRVLEPVVVDEGKKIKSGFSIRRLVRGNPVGLKPYKDLYLPSEASSINLLKSKMCIASPKEIGVVDMKNFGVQALLDPEDENLSFVFSRADIKPITVYRIKFAEYLVCYNEFAFFVDQRGRFIPSSARIDWEGSPDSFALSYPYVLAFEPEFIEVRHVHTGHLEQIIRGKNIRCTSSNTHNSIIQCAMNDPENEGYQIVYQLERVVKT